MNNYFKKLGVNIFFMLIVFAVYPQWENRQVSVFFSLPEVALVDIEPGIDNSIHFTIIQGAGSGSSPTIEQSNNNSLWLNYSSALPVNQNSRSITAEVSQGTVPKGLKIFLEASQFSGNGNGQRGISSGKIELTNQPRPIITGIGNSYTGDGVQSGHQLTFSVEISDFTQIETSGENNFLVLYTLTDN